MANLVLFVITTLTYWLAYWLYENWFTLIENVSFFNKNNFKHLAITSLLCLPLNINGNVFTVLGNIHSTGVKNVFSVFSVYQNAEENVSSIASVVQISGNDSRSILGPFYQDAGGNADAFLSVSLYQKAGRGSALTIFGVSVLQESTKKSAVIFIGGSMFQVSNQKDPQKNAFVAVLFGFAGLQTAKNVFVFAGISGTQKAINNAYHFVGFNLIQYAKAESNFGLGFSGYQYGLKKLTF